MKTRAAEKKQLSISWQLSSLQQTAHWPSRAIRKVRMHCCGFSCNDVKHSHFTCSWQLIRKCCRVNRSFCKALEWPWNSACLAELVTMSLPISIQISYFRLWLGYREIQRRKAERNGASAGFFFLSFLTTVSADAFHGSWPAHMYELHMSMSRLENSRQLDHFLIFKDLEFFPVRAFCCCCFWQFFCSRTSYWVPLTGTRISPTTT